MEERIKELLGHKVGDIITLSDIQTLISLGDDVSLPIIETRIYNEPEGAFTYYAYIIRAPAREDEEEGQKYMVLIRTVEDETEIQLLYLDQANSIDCYAEHLLDEEEDFTESFEVEIQGVGDVEWIKKFSWFGIDTETSEDEDVPPRTLGEYDSDTDERVSKCFLEWTGDEKEGYMEVWYGCPIKAHDIEIFERSE